MSDSSLTFEVRANGYIKAPDLAAVEGPMRLWFENSGGHANVPVSGSGFRLGILASHPGNYQGTRGEGLIRGCSRRTAQISHDNYKGFRVQ
jgi:hypothetical protein